jgi:hypothetical protein
VINTCNTTIETAQTYCSIGLNFDEVYTDSHVDYTRLTITVLLK